MPSGSNDMTVADFIVDFLIKKGITDVFGYPGGMVTPLMDAFEKRKDEINAHVTYHEQGAAFAACGYAQTTGKPGLAYATSGPGATNLITGICNAYFDSIPTIFITGQVNTNELKERYRVRQRGFQETDIVSMIKPVTKYATCIVDAANLPFELNKAYNVALSGRRGPVLLDIPMNVFKSVVDINLLTIDTVLKEEKQSISSYVKELNGFIHSAKAPVLLIGGGIKSTQNESLFRQIANKLKIPVVSSMIAFDVMKDSPLYYGFLGAYGSRIANFIVAKSDLVISVGSRMDIRQVGINRDNFAPNAKIVRFDVDKGELEYRVHKDEIQYCLDITDTLKILNSTIAKDFNLWIKKCEMIKSLLHGVDEENAISRSFSFLEAYLGKETIVTTDVGQNQVWVAQFLKIKNNQRVLFSGGHGAMGYSLPAAIGACYAVKNNVFCITGDGGLQMNIQELQTIARDNLPIKIIVFNNKALGMIRHFQEMYFSKRYFQTKKEGGYLSPCFAKIANAYGINSLCVGIDEISSVCSMLQSNGPCLIEIVIDEDTYVSPKLEFGKPNQDQTPLIDRELYKRIMEI